MIGDAVSKTTLYGDIEDQVKLRVDIVDNPRFSSALMLKEISLSVQKMAGAISAVIAPFYTTTDTARVITGTANPYIVDISGLSPFISKILRFVHVTQAGVRTMVKMVEQEEAERMQDMTNIYANSIWGVWEGDVIRLYKGSSFTITTGTDTTELKYVRTPKVGTVSAGTVVYDNAYTITGTTVTAFTGVLQTHIGATLVGNDASAVPFAKAITGYISSTSFTIDSTVTNPGSCTGGFIVPQNSIAITRGTYVDFPDQYIPMVILDVIGKVTAYENKGKPDAGIESQLNSMVQSAYNDMGVSKQLKAQP
jgi:hypothetical protein